MSDFEDISESEKAEALQAELERLATEVMQDPGADCFPRCAELHRAAGRVNDARCIAEAGLAASPENSAGELALALALIDLGDVQGAKEKLSSLLEREAGDYRWSSEPLAPNTPVKSLDSVESVESVDRAEPVALDEDAALAAPAFQPFEGDPSIPPVEAPVHASEFAAAELGGLDDAEFDDAFSQAEARPEEMVDVNEVAAEAMRIEELDEPETVFSAEALPTFATETMAGLLEAQGDAAGAESIRSALVEEAHELVESHVEPSWSEVDAAGPLPELATPVVSPAALNATDGVQRARIIATLERWLENLQRGTA